MTPNLAAQPGAGRTVPCHVAIIMDGNGRWAERRGLARHRGHREGVEALRRIAEAARDMGIRYLTLYSFSTENWSRPESEISELFGLLRLFIRRDLAELHKNNCRVRVAGSRDRLPADILSLLTDAERLTSENTGQTLILAFNYGARQEILRAAQQLANDAMQGLIDPFAISEEDFEARLHTAGIPDPDLVIRTSGEMRLSNFLLWQSAYAEFVFSPVLWPDFTAADLESAIAEYLNRKRRYGGLDAAQPRETGS